jgi:stage IV sporulation protein FB
MLIGEPPPSQADLHFRVLGIPVRVSPWFWAGSVMFAISGHERADPLVSIVIVAVIFASILVHELGHAFMQRRFGGRPWITLIAIGGLASCNDCDRSPKSQILISLAGPAAGFAFAALILAALKASGRQIVFGSYEGVLGFFLPDWNPPLTSWLLENAAFYLLQVNILWGIVNLLPVYPLDGGRVAREVLTLKNPVAGIVQSLWLSCGTAAAVAIYGLLNNNIFTIFMFGYLAYASYQTLQAYQSHWR